MRYGPRDVSTAPKPGSPRPEAEPRSEEPPGERLAVVSELPPPMPDPMPDGGSLLWRLGGLVRTLRPHQWVKNVFVLAPIFFAKDLFDTGLSLRAAGAFAVFCLLAGAVYTVNDLADAHADRQHPVKRYRPIASGRVSTTAARILAVLCITLGIAGAALGPLGFLATVVIYFILNLAYSFSLKNIAYVDVGCIATGFVLRVVAGGFATQITVSNYLLVCTALLALFLGFGKRRHEIVSSAQKGSKQRAALEGYNVAGLDVALSITALATVATYVAYTLDEHTRTFFRSDYLWLTTAFVVLAVMRFLHLVRSRPKAESPTQEMLKDGPFVALVLLWVMVVVWIVYNLRPS